MKLNARLALFVLFICFSLTPVFSQTTEFTYQGSLKDGANAANGNYDFEFALFDSLAAGTQIGTTLTRSTVAVAGGTFAVKLDFGSQFPGANRFLEIRVRLTGGGAFTPLTPRQLVNSAPYSVKSLSADNAVTAASAINAANATTAANATNALSLGGVAANQYVLTGDARLSDARSPLPGSGNYVQNTTGQQPATNFNISGNGTAGGTLSAQNINSTFEYRFGGQTFLNSVGTNSSFGVETGSANQGLSNTYSGFRAGLSATSNTSNNSFFGARAGRLNSLGNDNSFFGNNSGELNTFGGFNAFYGSNSGAANSAGNRNAFFGVTAGRDNTLGSDNTFVGGAAGQANLTGNNNSFFGSVAGTGTTTGSNNSFFGRAAGNVNVSGAFNTAIGDGANFGAGNLTFATAVGSGAIASASNSVVLGRPADTVQIPGTLAVTGAISGTASNSNQLGGIAANQYVTTTAGNASYIQNGTSQQSATDFNISGTGRASNFNATYYSISGLRALSSPELSSIFAGYDAGFNSSGGNHNSFFGNQAGLNTTGSDNTFVGWIAGNNNTTGSGNTLIGANASVNSLNLSNATAIGAGSVVSSSNSLVLGSINGFNGATSSVNVGIGTISPAYKLHVVGENVRVEGNTAGIFPRYSLNFTGGAVDAKKWQNYATTNSLTFTALNDAETSEIGWLTVNRAATAITSISFPNGNVNIGTVGTPDKLGVNGSISFATLGAAGSTPLCRNAQNQISSCSSSARYKENINSFTSGLALIRKLRPVSFNWKEGGMADMGLVAEEVNAVEPLLTTANAKGEVEGVKYDRIGVVLVNAVKEQQSQIEGQKTQIEILQQQVKEQRAEIDAFKALVCAQNPSAEVCRPKN